MTSVREPIGICRDGARLLAKEKAGRVSPRARQAVLDARCGLKDPLDCKVHAAAAIGRQWDTAERRLMS